jgi:hypothetical protein
MGATRSAAGAVAAAIAIGTVLLPARAAACQRPEPDEDPPAVSIDRTPRASAGPRMGVSINGDQWIIGGHLLVESLCLPGLGIEPVVLVGIGGNFLTLRPAGRVTYSFWIGGRHGVALAPALGVSALIWIPVGDFASFCNRTDLDGCGGHDIGFEIGGGLRWRWLRLEAMGGFGGLPVVTITLAADLPVWSSEP